MKHCQSDGVTLAYDEWGPGPETVVFSHSYLVDHTHFRHQIDSLARTHRVVAYDHRDHGQSGRAADGYALDDLVNDGEAVLDEVGASPCHWVGLSTGGFVGMRLALRDPDRFTTLTLMDTAGGRDSFFQRAKNRGLLTALRVVGVKPLLGQAMGAMFGPTFLADPDRADERTAWRDLMGANDADPLVRFGAAIFARDDVLDALGSLSVPTHVVVGEDDASLPVPMAERLAEAIPGAALTVIPEAGHLCTIEQPKAVTEAVAGFIGAHPVPGAEAPDETDHG